MDETIAVGIQPIEEMMGRLSARAVFGEPIREGEVTLIPVVSVAYGFGYGVGRKPADEGAAGAAPAKGSGSGAGGGGTAKPQGFIRIAADGVRYEPINDPARFIPLAGILLSAWSVFWIAKTIRAFARR
jgi:uncharacterized spore protein YtfJ